MRYNEILEYDLKNIGQTRIKQLIEHPRFKAWFRNSKVVDDNNLPLVCHHYSFSKKNFNLFKPFSHFGSSKAAIDRYDTVNFDKIAGGKTFPVLLSIQQPMLIPDLEGHDYIDYHNCLVMGDYGMKYAIFEEEELPEPNEDDMNDQPKMTILQKNLLKKGIDGFKYTNDVEDAGKYSWITLKPGQAMSIFKLLKLVM